MQDEVGLAGRRPNGRGCASDPTLGSAGRTTKIGPCGRSWAPSQARALAIMDSVGTLVPQLALLLLSPRTATLGLARGVESRDSFDSLDSVEDAGRVACAIGGQYITTVGAIIFIIGSVINFIAFALVPASILAPPLESIQVRSVV